MRLNKFGVILKFAIDLEQRAVELYEAAARIEASRDLEEAAAGARKRMSRLRMMRRELVNEMLLEPIAGFDQPPLPALEVGSADRERVREQQARIEQARKDFYATAAVKIAIVAPSVSRAFRRMADEM